MERKTFIINKHTIIIHLVGLSAKSFSNRHIHIVSFSYATPLDPCSVEVGAVGYFSKPQDRFVTLFNALTPDKAMQLGIQISSLYSLIWTDIG